MTYTLRLTTKNGLTTEFSTTLYYDLNLIFDRTLKDLYNKTDKSFYNAIDLNRVESATYYIEGLLRLYSYFKSNLTYKRNWALADFPNQNEMTRYLNNIQELVDAYYVKIDTPKLPESMNNLTLEKANAIEKILYDMKKLIENMISQFYYSGELFSGEV